MNPQYYKEDEIDAMFAGLGNSTTLQQVTNGENKNLIEGKNFQGTRSGDNATNANNSNFLGTDAGLGATNANQSNFFGLNAGEDAVGANNSNFFGRDSGMGATSANNSNFFGINAGQGATFANNSNFFGPESGQGATNALESNFIGVRAGRGANSARHSTFIGYRSGESFTGNNVGANNIIIGTNISLPNGDANRINIGGIIFGTETYNIQTGNPKTDAVSNGRVQIGTNVDNTVDRLQVQGTILSTQYKISALNTAPASATAIGTLGEIRITADFIYVCVATNTWVRTALTTW